MKTEPDDVEVLFQKPEHLSAKRVIESHPSFVKSHKMRNAQSLICQDFKHLRKKKFFKTNFPEFISNDLRNSYTQLEVKKKDDKTFINIREMKKRNTNQYTQVIKKKTAMKSLFQNVEEKEPFMLGSFFTLNRDKTLE